MHQSTREIPFVLWCGRLPPAINSLSFEDEINPSTLQERAKELVTQMSLAFQSVLELTNDAKEISAQQATVKTSLQNRSPGDTVWLYEPQLSSAAGSRKMYSPWSCPFLILEVNNNKTATLLYPRSTDVRGTIVVNVDRLRRYQTPLLQSLSSCKKIVQQVLSRKLQNGQELFKVRWLSLTPVEDSWVPAAQVPANLLDLFYRRSEAPAPSSSA